MKTASALTKSHPRGPAKESLYQRDYYAWVQSQVQALKQRQLDDLDLKNLSEEVADLGTSLRHELRSRMRVILTHLLKWHFQPSKRSSSWELTLLEQRARVRDLLDANPSLRREVAEFLSKAYESGIRMAGAQMKLAKNDVQRTFPPHCPWTPEQILDDDFLPNASRSASR